VKKLLLASVAALVLASVAAAEEGDAEWQKKFEEKMSKVASVNFQDTTLNKAIEYFRGVTGANIILDAKATDLSEKRLTLVLKGVRAESGLAWTARLMGLDYVVRDEAIFLAKPDDMPREWRGEMQERYRRLTSGGQAPWVADIEARLARNIKMEFRGEQLPEVVQVLAAGSGINIVLDFHLAAAQKSVRLEGEMSVKNALNWIAKQTDVRYVVRDEVIYVADRESLAALRLEQGEAPLDLLFLKPVSFRFRQTPIRDAIAELSKLSGVTIDLQGFSLEDTGTVSAEGTDMPISRAVEMVVKETRRPYALSYRGKTIVVVVSPKAKPDKEPAKVPAPAK